MECSTLLSCSRKTLHLNSSSNCWRIGQTHTCQPYRIFRENHGKLTSIPVYRGIYKIYRIFKKIECTATSRDLTRAEYSKPCADSVLPRVLTSFLLEISVDLATCRLKACYLNRLPLLCSCGDSDLVGQVIWK